MHELPNSSPPLTTASSASAEASTAPPKKKRNQPGMPDPESEVVALSPKTLMATNRFVCEICGKGFQRDQNLQLHRRGHNLPWKLRQRGTQEVRRRVYVCPESSCVHHDPKRALGDLTGIKKHFCRKHGEKKWKCERCSKKYAVQSDCKAHMKTCGTKEYKCDCGTVFSRRDSFVTHRAFCDALAQETVKVQLVQVDGESFGGVSASGEKRNGGSMCSVSAGSPRNAEATEVTALSSSVRSPVVSIQSSEVQETSNTLTAPMIIPTDGGGASSANNAVFGSVFAPLSGLGQHQQQLPQASQFSALMAAMSSSSETLASPLEQVEQPSLSLSSSLYQFNHDAPTFFHNHHHPPPPALSATALLQKAAQMGATTSPSSLYWGFGGGDANNGVVEIENGGGGMIGGFMGSGPMMNGLGPAGLFAARPTTLDLLGLGIGPSGSSPSGPSTLLDELRRTDGVIQVRSDVDQTFGENSWGGPSTTKPNHTVP